MTAVTIALPTGAQVLSAANKVTLTNATGQPITLPVTDPKVPFGEMAPNWVEVPKPGLIEAPYTVRGPRPLRSLTLNVTIVDTTYMLNSVEAILKKLYNILQSSRITLAYADYESSIAISGSGFICTSYQPHAVMRDPNTNKTIQATASITLKEGNPPPAGAGAGATQ